MKIETMGIAGCVVLIASFGVTTANAENATYETVTYTDWVCRAISPSPPPPPPPPPPCDPTGGSTYNFSLSDNGNLSFTSIGFSGFGCDTSLSGLSGFGGFQLDGGNRSIEECREGFQREPFETTETTRTCTDGNSVEGSRPSWGGIIPPNTSWGTTCTE